MTPYQIRVWVDGDQKDTHNVEDPFHTTTVVTGWSRWDWFKMFFRRKIEFTTTVDLKARKPGVVMRVMNALHEDCAGCGTGETDTHGDHDPRPQVYGGTSNG